VEISGYHRKVRGHAQLLLSELDLRLPNGFDPTGNVAPLLDTLGIRLHVVDQPPSGCSVAGSCNHQTQTVTVVSAGKGRMRFTALHEVGHLIGEDLDAFQDAVFEHAKMAGAHVEEDACDAFAAILLLPDFHLDNVLDDRGVSARGLRDLIIGSQASMEACAVAMAQRLASPGYVLLVDADGTTRFAARSGDVLPIRRGTDQTGSDLSPLFAGRPTLRSRGMLAFNAGSSTHELYLDAVEHHGLVLALACESDPGWEQLQTASTASSIDRRVHAHCLECCIDFTSWRLCSVCSEPRHETCGRCACEPSAARGERRCTACFQTLPPPAFTGSSTACTDCTG
jgi:hypothetical protein